MSHQTFYRKYRSQTFSDLVGQDHVIQTLKNGIIHNRLTHAHIFSGPRGTGKTSTARILAKSLNCRKGSSDTPCLTCDLCQKITKGSAVDVVEIDAASNTGVDNIRTLNDQVNFAPVECQTKIYIIDEAHMLSTGAFNALLKTLEEPPANTVFILATTEPHKLPVTIHSRCQHLHFRLMTTQEIVDQLQKIADSESITIDETALTTIARNAGGSMRDAVSLLDQIYAFKGRDIALEDVLLSLGSSNIDSLIELMVVFFGKDAKATMVNLTKLIDQGLNMTQLMGDILEILKQLVFVKMDLAKQLDLDEARITKLKVLAQPIDVVEIKDALTAFAKAEVDLKWFPNPALLLQVTFLTQLHTKPNLAHHDLKSEKIPGNKSTSTQNVPFSQSSKKNPLPESVAHQSPSQSSPSVKSGSFSLPNIPSRQTVVSQPLTKNQIRSSDNQVHSSDPWLACQDQIRSEKHALYALVKGSKVIVANDTELIVALSKNFKFFREKLREASNKAYIEKVIQKHYQRPLAFKVDEGDQVPKEMPQSIHQEKATRSASTKVTQTQSLSEAKNPTMKLDTHNPFQRSVDSHKLDKRINQIIQMFDGELVS